MEDAPLIHQLAEDFKTEVGEAADVTLQIWAGPFELMVAVRDLLEATGVATTGIAALLTALKRRKPQYDVQIEIDKSTTVKITGEELPPAVADMVDQFFADHSESTDMIGSPVRSRDDSPPNPVESRREPAAEDDVNEDAD